MRSALNQLVYDPRGVFVVLSLAAVLEALGDSCFQSGLHRTSGVARVISLAAGVVVLSLYGALVNVPSWQFGRLPGVYIVFFFLVAQILGRREVPRTAHPADCPGRLPRCSGRHDHFPVEDVADRILVISGSEGFPIRRTTRTRTVLGHIPSIRSAILVARGGLGVTRGFGAARRCTISLSSAASIDRARKSASSKAPKSTA